LDTVSACRTSNFVELAGDIWRQQPFPFNNPAFATLAPHVVAGIPNSSRPPCRSKLFSGMRHEERPIRFRLGGQDYFVEELLDQWYGPHNVFFKVRANDGNVYILRRRSSVPEGEWSLESFRDMRRGG